MPAAPRSSGTADPSRAAALSPRALFALALVALLIALGGCAPRLAETGLASAAPRLELDGPEGPRFVPSDGIRLPLRVWRPGDAGGSGDCGEADGPLQAVPIADAGDCAAAPGDPAAARAVILALHGFNDYSNAFEMPGRYWADRGVITYAYDQRGFGGAPQRGLWAGSQVLARDLTEAARLVHARHPEQPLYLLGESMGGAVILVAMSSDDPPPADGVILAAPAVWARETMPLVQRIALWLAAHSIPWASFTGQGLGVQASDNLQMLRALGRDPLFIKETRVDAVYGLVELMDQALAAGPGLRVPALLLYGEKDEIVPPEPSFRLWRSLPADAAGMHRTALYAEGWHMLLRDLGRRRVLDDVLAWLAEPAAPLPSFADRNARAALAAGAGDGATDVASGPAGEPSGGAGQRALSGS